MYDQAKNTLVRKSRTITLRVLAVSVGLFLTSYAAISLLKDTGTENEFSALISAIATTGVDEAYVAALILVIIAAGNAYYGGGILLSWTLVFAPLFAAFLAGFLGAPVDGSNIVFVTGLGLLFAGVLGTVGYVLGAGIRRLTT